MSGAGNLVHLPAAELETAQKITNVMGLLQAQSIISELEKAHFHVERNANPKILFLDVSLQIIKTLKFKTIRQNADTLYTWLWDAEVAQQEADVLLLAAKVMAHALPMAAAN